MDTTRSACLVRAIWLSDGYSGNEYKLCNKPGHDIHRLFVKRCYIYQVWQPVMLTLEQWLKAEAILKRVLGRFMEG